jgi:hypothetical protein
MRRHGVGVVALSVTFVAFVACGGGGTGGRATSTGGGGKPKAGAIEVRKADQPLGAVDPTETSCRYDGDRQLLARGIVRNAGDKSYSVSIAVRFVDAKGVRVEIANDSVSDLQQGESARWDASTYSDDAGSVVACELSTSANG